MRVEYEEARASTLTGATQRSQPRSTLVVGGRGLDTDRIVFELRRCEHWPVTVAVPPLDGLKGECCPTLVVVNASIIDVDVSLRHLRRSFGSSRLVVVGNLTAATAFEVARSGADAYVPHPIDHQRLAAAVRGETYSQRSSAQLPSLAWAEWEYLHSVLALCNGNRSEAARRLGIHRSVLQRKLARNAPLR